MTIAGWRVWPYLLSLVCLPVGGLLEALNDLAAAGIPHHIPWLVVLAGLPSALVNGVAVFRGGELVLDRAARRG